MNDWITDAVNMLLERLDRLIDAVERVAEAAEKDDAHEES